MTKHLLSLRLWNSSGLLRVSRMAYTLGRAAPFRLKNPCLFSSSGQYSGARAFSSRPATSRAGVGRGGLRSNRVAGQGKSLIEDEAELSDWVSDLKTESFRLSLSSDGEDSDRDRGRNGRGRGRDRVVRGRDLDSFSQRRKPQSSIGFSERSPRGSISKRRFDSEEEEEDSFDTRRVNGRRGGSSSTLTRRGGSSTLARRGGSSTLTRVGGRDLGSSYRQGRGVRGPAIAVSDEKKEEEETDDNVLSDFEDDYFGSKAGEKEEELRRFDSEEEEEDGFDSWRVNGRRGGPSSTLTRRGGSSTFARRGGSSTLTRGGGRDLGSSYRQGRGVRGPAIAVSDEEEEDEETDDNVLSDFEDDYVGSKVGEKKEDLRCFDSEEEEEDSFDSSRVNGRRGGPSSTLTRRGGSSTLAWRGGSSTLTRGGGRDLGSSYRQGRGARGPALAVSDAEEEEEETDDNILSDFEDDSFGSKVGEKKEDLKDVFKSAGSPELDERESIPTILRSSVGDKDSYLSRTL